MTLINIVLPIFLVIGLGYALRARRFLSEGVVASLSRLVFYVAAPSLLFRSTSRNTFNWDAHLLMLAAIAGITILVAAAVYGIGYRHTPARRGVLAQGCIRSNTVFIGLPLVLNAYGEFALPLVSIVIAFMVVVENLLSVLLLTLPHQGSSSREAALWGRTLLRTLRNPLLIGCVGGLLCAALHIPLPISIDRTLQLVGATAAPLGLLCVGAALRFRQLRSEIPGAATAAGLRLIVHPALIFLALRALGMRGVELGVPILVMACPAAVTSYIMAREMDGDAAFASAIIIGTTVAALLTLPAWLALLGMN